MPAGNYFIQRRQKPSLLRRLLYGLAAGATLSYMLYSAVAGPNGWLDYFEKKRKVEQLEKEIAILRTELAEKKKRIEKLKNDPEAIELEARRRLLLAKPGETIFVLPEKRAPDIEPQLGPPVPRFSEYLSSSKDEASHRE